MSYDDDITLRSGYMDKCEDCPNKDYCRVVTGILIAITGLEEMHRKKEGG